jgi:hypothetical protein
VDDDDEPERDDKAKHNVLSCGTAKSCTKKCTNTVEVGKEPEDAKDANNKDDKTKSDKCGDQRGTIESVRRMKKSTKHRERERERVTCKNWFDSEQIKQSK